MPKWFHILDSSVREKISRGGKDYQSIANKCEFMDTVLQSLENKSVKMIENSDVQWSRIQDKIEENKDHFEFCKDFATGEISKDEWGDYDFGGDLVGMYNGYLAEFFDLCDSWVDKDTKFCWVQL